MSLMALAVIKPVLARFHPTHAAAIASWIRDERQLHWVSPSTEPPLTPDKVLQWPRPDGEAFVLLPDTADGSSGATGPGAPGRVSAGGEPSTGGLPEGAEFLSHPEPLAYSEINHMRSGQGNWWIGHFVVHPEHRGQGLGRTLLSGLLAEAFENLEANSVCLVVFPENIAAMRCYESAGFQRIGNEYHRFASHQPRTRLLRYEMTKEVWLKTIR